MSGWKSPLLFLGIALILAAGAAFVAPFFVDWNSYKTRLEIYGERLTGRSVRIKGDVSARLFPWPRLQLRDVRVANPPGSLVLDLLRAREIDIELALAPLMSGRLVVEGVDMQAPVLGLEQMPDGRGTWQIEPRMELSGLLDAERVAVDTIRIENGTVFLGDGRKGGIVKLEDVDADLSAPTLLGPWRLRGQAMLNGIPMSIGVGTGKHVRDEPLNFSLRLGPLDSDLPIVAFDGTVGGAEEAPLAGRLKIWPHSLQHGKSDAGPSLPPLVLAADFESDLETVHITKMELTPERGEEGGTLLSGEAALRLGPTIDLKARLEAPVVDLDKVLGVPATKELLSGRGLRVLAGLLERLPQTVTAELDLAATRLTFAGETLESVELRAEVSPGRIKIGELALSMPGQSRGRFEGLFVASGGTPLMSGRLSLQAGAARDLLLWSVPEVGETVNEHWTGPRGELEFSASVDATPNALRIRSGDYAIDGMRGNVEITYADGEAALLSARIVAHEFDLDRYLSRGLQQEPDELAANVAELFKGAMTFGEFRLTLQSDSLRLHGVTARDIAVDIAADDSTVELRTVEIGDVEGARMVVTGLVHFPDEAIAGTVKSSITASDPRGLLRLLTVLPPQNTLARDPEWAHLLGAVELQSTIEAVAQDGWTNLNASAKGTAGASAVTLAGHFDGDVIEWREADTGISASIDGNSARLLNALAGLGLDLEPETSARLVVKAQGRPERGIATEAALKLLGAEFGFRGSARFVPDSAVALTGKAELLAPQPAELLGALDIPASSDTAAQPLSAAASVALADDVLKLDELESSVAGTSLGGSVQVSFENEQPHLKADLAVQQLDLAWLLAASLLQQSDVEAGLETPFVLRAQPSLTRDVTIAAGSVGGIAPFALGDATVQVTSGTEGWRFVLDGRGRDNEPLHLQADAQIGSTGLALAGTAKGTLAVSQLLQTPTGDPVLQGQLTLASDFAGTGFSTAGLIADLTGSGTYRLENAVLHGMDGTSLAGALAGNITPEQLDAAARAALRGSETALGAVEGTVTLGGGIAAFSPIPFDGPALRGRLKPLVELTSGRADLSARLTFKHEERLPSFELAYAGPLQSLEPSLELAALKDYMTVIQLNESVTKLEALQREEERILREDSEFERRQVMREKLEEAEARRRREEAGQPQASGQDDAGGQRSGRAPAASPPRASAAPKAKGTVAAVVEPEPAAAPTSQPVVVEPLPFEREITAPTAGSEDGAGTITIIRPSRAGQPRAER